MERKRKIMDFPTTNEEQLDKILLEYFGECGKCEETVNVIIDLYESGVEINGLIIANRRSRDSAVTLNKNAVLLSGGFPESGGSAKNPRCCPYEGTKVRITVSKEWHENNKDDESIELVNNSEAIDKSKLIEEKERLLARIAEIDKLLSE